MKSIYRGSDANERFLAHLKRKKTQEYDIILDDGSYVMSVLGYADELFGIVVGGHSGFTYFSDIAEINDRKIKEEYEVSGIFGIPFIGYILRIRRLRKSKAHPAIWMPKK